MTDGFTPTAEERRTSRGQVLALVLLIVAGAGFGWWSTRAGPDSRPAANPSGEIAAAELVGTQRCAECHVAEAAAHARSGHSRTFARTRDSAVAMQLCDRTVPPADGYGQFTFQCDAEGLMVGLEGKFGGRLFPLDFAFGSGEHAVTFLTLTEAIDAENGVLGIEHRNTWYHAREDLGITPGQEEWVPEREIEQFGRSYHGETLRRCIDCHTTAFELVGARLENVVAGVQCEECHGPGREHVDAAVAGDLQAARSALQKPRTPAEDVQLCGRCHRLPGDIDADRLARYPPSLTRFQPVGLLQSRCYLKSEGRMGCLTCHDAHDHLSSRTADDQVAACRSCHQTEKDPLCSAGHGSECVSCHMRKLELIPGIYFHDHWIRTRPEVNPSTEPGDATTVSGEPPET
jgi:hypothetical protein